MMNDHSAERQGGCDHVGGPELIEMSEDWLRKNDIPEGRWEGGRFGWGEEVDSPYWKSVYIEVERRSGNWVVTKIDRLNEGLAESMIGFRVVKEPWATDA